MNEIVKRLESLRQEMIKNDVKATIIPGTDPHASEYLAKHWHERNWIAGFTGSAGTAVVTLDKALLWTDSRYFIQAETQLTDTGFELMKDRLPETPTIPTWLTQNLDANVQIGLNPQMFSHDTFHQYQIQFQAKNITIKSIDLIAEIWKDRPDLPQNPILIFDEKYAGKSVSEKLAEVRNEMLKSQSDTYVISALDEIAWLFNIRGNDVKFNPLVIAYAVIDQENATLFIDENKLDKNALNYFEKNKISIQPYSKIDAFLNQIYAHSTVLFDGQILNQSLYESLPESVKKVNIASPISLLKSIKNQTEIEGFRQAMIKDGVALTKFFKWLEENVDSKEITEHTVGKKLIEFRKEQTHFQGPSFNTICGYAANGAMNHYSAKKETASTIGRDELLLIDSGGQYFEGTTDITRTLTLGQATTEEKKDYTLVLKGMIALSEAKFPKNTRGTQLDAFARQYLWQNTYNFGHGTGHGIGHFLCVHEGPQSIRMDENPVTLKPGMIVSNEPGLYRDHQYGIRIENLILVEEFQQSDFGEFYQFETLTLCYIDTNLIDMTLLTENEQNWLNNYHQTVLERLVPHLSMSESAWLKNKCKAI